MFTRMSSFNVSTVGTFIFNAAAEEFYHDAIRGIKERKVIVWTGAFAGAVSIKEHIAQEGRYETGGLVCPVESHNEHDALIILIFRQAITIPVCLGDVCQMMFLPECINNIYVRTSNP